MRHVYNIVMMIMHSYVLFLLTRKYGQYINNKCKTHTFRTVSFAKARACLPSRIRTPSCTYVHCLNVSVHVMHVFVLSVFLRA